VTNGGDSQDKVLKNDGMSDLVLQGRHVRLEPLSMEHAEGLVRASSGDAELYKWSAVPRGEDAVRKYVETALEWKTEGTAEPFAIVRLSDGVVIGSSRFFDLERWVWPEGHARFGRTEPDVGEIGYTWYAHEAIRTAANTEAKTLMLTHAFERWGMLRICLHTDARNERSRRAMERIGCRFEGILRSHRLAVDFIPRDSARFSIVTAEWAEVKARLAELSARR
jgi:N-acetyltransferase